MKKLLFSLTFSLLFVSIFANNKLPIVAGQIQEYIITNQINSDPVCYSSWCVSEYTMIKCPGKKDVLTSYKMKRNKINCTTGTAIPNTSQETAPINTGLNCNNAQPNEQESEIGD